MPQLARPWPGFVVLAVLLSAVALRASDIPWPGHGTLSLDAPAKWQLSTNPEGNIGYTLRLTPSPPAVGLLLITFIALPENRVIRADQVKDELGQLAQRSIPGSVEKKFTPIALKCAQGTGWYAQFTDASLVGKPPVPNNYKLMRNALVALDEHLLAIVTMEFDDAKSPEAAAMLSVAESLRFKSAPSSAAKTGALSISQDDTYYVIRYAPSRLAVKIPRAGLAIADTGANQPGYFHLADQKTGLVISGWFDQSSAYRGIKSLWKGDTASWKEHGVPKPLHVKFDKIDGWETVAYENDLGDFGNSHLRAERTGSGTWLDLHLSLSTKRPIKELRAELLAALKAIVIEEH